MHPGPMNRGVEIARRARPSCPGAVITQQVTNGVAVRMAVLFELLGAGTRCGGRGVSVAHPRRPGGRPQR